ncbi:hypothetical protein JI721_13330 [Alicyclobacillus cycloheptanicus]|uniref:Uncharacterized protein n=1 Tax=Alicyclobacillus cycloheptanicus TaxID=1457 RepID=A0ABT9XED3_9BACL|nr:hypothetical protein [Alicyclobacillus cycloheptanicus]MDQ0188654.1 hypothetical protein [Alicyclobacillus cycloheptanicus]WDM00671.1 hypothetical protein JI721_13330 [Alicyclobacillus cycloheptanicus]
MNFHFDERLGIELPDLSVPFEALPPDEQEQVLVRWEKIRARIPDQIMAFERVIQGILDQIQQEEDWDVIVNHFHQISDYASRIHELNTWQRVDQTLTNTSTHDEANVHLDREP